MITVISTFSGVGGSSLGYKLAGCDVRLALEFIPIAAKNYRINFPDTPVIEKDIRNVNGKQLLKFANLKEVDILDGSPPCSAFSMLGSREDGWGKIRKYSDSKQRVDDLFDEQIRIIDEIKPKAIVIENVKGMTLGIAKPLLQNFIVKIQNIGYDVTAEILNAKYFETASARERMFIVGFRKDLKIKPSLPKPFAKPISFGEAVKTLKQDKNEVDYAESRLLGSPKMYNCVRQLKQGQSGDKVMNGSYFSHRRLSMNECIPTLTTKMDTYHPTEDRFVTISELKRCASFPDDFKLIGTFDQQWERIGRAVPPNLMKHIASHIKKLLENNS